MKLNTLKKYLLIILVFFCSLILTGCKKEEKPNYVNKRYSYFSYLDTMSSVTVQFDKNIVSEEQMAFNMKKIEDILLDIEKNFSVAQTINMNINHIAESLLMKVNKNAGKYDDDNNLVMTKVNEEFINILEMSNDLSILLEGSFDITVYPLSNLWNIPNQVGLPEELVNIPTKEQIDEKLKLVDYKKIIIDKENNQVGLPIKGMGIDLGAIAKGYAADKVLEYVKTLPITIALIDLGGNIYVWGESSVTKTSIGIRNPFWNNESTEPFQIMQTEITNISAVTSGVYERFVVKDGVTYHHLLNPLTGYPFDNEIASVSIIGTSSALCDGIATGIYGLGLEAGIEKIKSLEGYRAVFITRDKNVYVVGDIDFTTEKGTENFKFNYL